MRVLIAYDGSDCARAAIDDLRRAGLPGDTDAIVMTVAEVWPGLLETDPPDSDVTSNPAVQRLIRRARRRAEQTMEDARELSQRGAERVRMIAPTWNVRAQAVPGWPDHALLVRAAQWKADLIVVGSHGRSAMERIALGSVSHQLLQHAPCSVRVGRRVDNEAAGGRSERGVKILLGVDGSVSAATAVSAVASRTWPQGSEVRVVTVSDPAMLLHILGLGETSMVPPQPPRVFLPEEDERAYFFRMLAAVARELEETGLMATTAVLEGDPKHVLLQEAKRWGADCAFLGARGLRGMERFLTGSVSSAVAARAQCSVEIIRA